MKRCPKCDGRFAEEYDFCLNDGTVLAADNQSAQTLVFGSASGPTPVPPVSKASPVIYVAIGAMAATIAALGFVVYWTARGNSGTNTNTAWATPQAPAASREPTPARTAANSSTVVQGTPTQPDEDRHVDVAREEAAIGSRLQRWAAAGEARDADALMASYAPVIAPYYRARNAKRSVVYNDKSRAYRQFENIEISLENIQINLEPGGERARVVLDKGWRFSGNRYSEGKVQQEIGLVKTAGEWLIDAERDIRVYYKRP